MNKEDIDFILETISGSVCLAIDNYAELSGEFADTIPESVMSLGGLHGLKTKKISAMLEVTAKILRERLASEIPDGEHENFESAMKRLGSGRVDLVVLWGDGGPRHRQPVGFIEFKLWKYCEDDAARVTELVSKVPGARFGASIILKDTPPGDTWIQTLRDKLGEAAHVSARDVSTVTKRNHPCQVVCCTQLRRV